MSEQAGDFDLEVDVVVLGTGGAGLTAALAAHDFGAGEVLILEKYGMIGGTSAMSGGMLWLPLNDQEAENGVEDSFEEIVSYLDGLAAENTLEPENVGAFLPDSLTISRMPSAARCTAVARSTTRPSHSTSSAPGPSGSIRRRPGGRAARA